jgi:hypothetical protein
MSLMDRYKPMGRFKTNKQQASSKPRDFDKDTKTEINALEDSLSKNVKKTQQFLSDLGNSEYWFCVCFQSQEQKDHFLHLLGAMKDSGARYKGATDPVICDEADKYLDGLKLAKHLGLTLKPGPKLVGPKRRPRLEALT